MDLPAGRLQEAFARIFAGAAPMAFPDDPEERRPARERAWWRDQVRATFRAADSSASFRDFDAFFDALFAYFARASSWVARGGAFPALDALRGRGLRLGVVSNFDHRLPGILEGLGLARAFDAVVLPVAAGTAKPDPRIFALALERLGVPAGVAVYVGDDPERDLRAARSAGLHALDVGSLDSLERLPGRLAALEAGGDGLG